jgi:hypothetical protein
MSQENVEIVRSSIETYNADGLEAAMAFLHPEVEWHTNLEWPEAPIFRGHDGIRELSSLLQDCLPCSKMCWVPFALSLSGS